MLSHIVAQIIVRGIQLALLLLASQQLKEGHTPAQSVTTWQSHLLYGYWLRGQL